MVVFGQFRFAPTSGYHATFANASRLKAGNDVRIAGVPVGSVTCVSLNPDNTVDVAFNVDKRYQLYTSTRALIRYENLVGDRFLEITSGPGELRKLAVGQHHFASQHPARARSGCAARRAAAGAERPGRQQDQRDQQRRHAAAAGPGRGAVDLLANTGAFTQNLAARYQLISDVINHLNTVLGTVDAKGAQFNASVDQLQKLITGLAEGRDPIAGAIPPLASATNDLTDMLAQSRRPIQGVIENVRPLASDSTSARPTSTR